MLNKKLVLLGMLLAVKAAYAQSSSTLEVYGILDIGIGHDTHALSESSLFPTGLAPIVQKTADHAVTGLMNSGESPTRLGFRGSEDMGDGLKAIFALETGFNPQFGTISNSVGSLAANGGKTPSTFSGDASLAGQLFNRQSWVGLSSTTWGTVTAGRVYSLGYETITAHDPMDGSQIFSPLGFSGVYGGGGFSEDFRLDNSVTYKYASNGFNGGLLYKFGGQSGSTSAQSVGQLTGGYASGPFDIQATYSRVKDGFLAATSATLGSVNLTVADTEALMLAAGYKNGAFHLRGGYEREQYKNPSNPELDAGITTVLGYPVAAVNVTAFTHEKKQDVYFAGVNYDFTGAFTGTAAVYDVQQNNYSAGACTTGSNVASCSGSNRFYSALADYKLSKRSHLYAGVMYNRVEGGLASGFLHNTNIVTGTGFKHTF